MSTTIPYVIQDATSSRVVDVPVVVSAVPVSRYTLVEYEGREYRVYVRGVDGTLAAQPV